MTIHNLHVTLLRSFAPGQIYVALSRASTLEGLTIGDGIDRKLIVADERVKEFYRRV